MTQKFLINTYDGLVELEYDDVKTKKLTNFCGVIPHKGFMYTAYVLIALAVILTVYDFFKDIGRQVSSVKDLVNGKEGGLAKFVGFTKGNIVRAIGKFVLFILGSIFYSLSTSMGKRTCIKGNVFLLERVEQLIKYDDKGIPVEIVNPTDKAAVEALREKK